MNATDHPLKDRRYREIQLKTRRRGTPIICCEPLQTIRFAENSDGYILFPMALRQADSRLGLQILLPINFPVTFAIPLELIMAIAEHLMN